MITEAKIKELVDARIEGTELFVVDVQVAIGNKISVLLDGFNGVGINDCVSISRGVESNLDREDEDFELHVSSAGLDMPLKVKQQYVKNVGRSVKIITMDGHKHEGALTVANDELLEIQYEEKVKIEGRKKKELVTQVEKYYFEHEDEDKKIKETKIIISFK
jgi:ribosome maturation factor RimP